MKSLITIWALMHQRGETELSLIIAFIDRAVRRRGPVVHLGISTIITAVFWKAGLSAVGLQSVDFSILVLECYCWSIYQQRAAQNRTVAVPIKRTVTAFHLFGEDSGVVSRPKQQYSVEITFYLLEDVEVEEMNLFSPQRNIANSFVHYIFQVKSNEPGNDNLAV